VRSRWLTLGVPPPVDPANRVDALRFLRALMVRSLVVSVVFGAIVVALLQSTTWAIVIGAVVALTALDALFLTWRLRREERR
jgi:O-antigen/teichoic acid export membrane protein